MCGVFVCVLCVCFVFVCFVCECVCSVCLRCVLCVCGVRGCVSLCGVWCVAGCVCVCVCECRRAIICVIDLCFVCIMFSTVYINVTGNPLPLMHSSEEGNADLSFRTKKIKF